MSLPDEIFLHTPDGKPVLQDGCVTSAKGGIFAGWSAIERQDKPFEVPLWHRMGTTLYIPQIWFWRQGAPRNHLSWTGKKPHPDEAGPVKIITTTAALYCYFEPNKPIFAEYNELTDRYHMINEGWIGALLIPG